MLSVPASSNVYHICFMFSVIPHLTQLLFLSHTKEPPAMATPKIQPLNAQHPFVTLFCMQEPAAHQSLKGASLRPPPVITCVAIGVITPFAPSAYPVDVYVYGPMTPTGVGRPSGPFVTATLFTGVGLPSGPFVNARLFPTGVGLPSGPFV
jgi:hypothetical protein